MQPLDTTTEVKNTVISFLCLHNDNNFLLPTVVIFNVLRNNTNDDANFGKTLSVASITNWLWIYHAQDQSWGASSLKPDILFMAA